MIIVVVVVGSFVVAAVVVVGPLCRNSGRSEIATQAAHDSWVGITRAGPGCSRAALALCERLALFTNQTSTDGSALAIRNAADAASRRPSAARPGLCRRRRSRGGLRKAAAGRGAARGRAHAASAPSGGPAQLAGRW